MWYDFCKNLNVPYRVKSARVFVVILFWKQFTLDAAKKVWHNKCICLIRARFFFRSTRIDSVYRNVSNYCGGAIASAHWIRYEMLRPKRPRYEYERDAKSEFTGRASRRVGSRWLMPRGPAVRQHFRDVTVNLTTT